MSFSLDLVPEQFRAYFEAHKDGKLDAYYLVELRKRRDDYSNELPDTDVRLDPSLTEAGLYAQPKFKCRGNYIIGLSLLLAQAMNDGVITDESVRCTIDAFRTYDFNFHHGRNTSPTELAFVNTTLNLAIASLEK